MKIAVIWMISILKSFMLVFEDGKELSGIDAFIYVWKRTDGYNWLSKIISLPVVIHLAKISYFFLAYILYWRYKFFVK